MSEIYTTQEVANILDVDPRRTTLYAQKHKLPKFGGRYIYKKEDINLAREYFRMVDQLYKR